MIINDNSVILNRSTWNKLNENEFYREILEMIEDIELLEQAKKETQEFVDLDDYHKNRINDSNV